MTTAIENILQTIWEDAVENNHVHQERFCEIFLVAIEHNVGHRTGSNGTTMRIG